LNTKINLTQTLHQ